MKFWQLNKSDQFTWKLSVFEQEGSYLCILVSQNLKVFNYLPEEGRNSEKLVKTFGL